MVGSPAIFTSTVDTEPQVTPDPKKAHSPICSLPPAVVLGVILRPSTCDPKTRTPVDPVSSTTLLITAHFEVPCAHTVIEVNGTSTLSNGPLVTENESSLGGPAGVAVGVAVAVAVSVGVGVRVAVRVGVGVGVAVAVAVGVGVRVAVAVAVGVLVGVEV